MSLNQFWIELAAAQKALLMLDYDGTLAPFQIERNQAVPYPGIRERLNAIRQNTETRLVIISGRAVDVLLPLLGLNPPPEVWGCHGWEHFTADGQSPEVFLPELAQTGLNNARLWIIDQELSDFCENKPASLAIHWRGLSSDQINELHDRVQAGWQSIASVHKLEIHPFNGGLELRCPGRDKGTAIVSILEKVGPEVPVAFLGDDITDEDGFAVVKNRGIGVLVSNEVRQTKATLQISPPTELLDFLYKWYIHAPRRKNKRETT